MERSGAQDPGTTIDAVRALARRRAEQQRVIADLARAALTELDLDVLFDKAVETTARHLDAPLCKVLQRTDDGQRLFLRSGVGWRDGLVGEVSVPADAGSQGGFTLIQDQPVVVVDLRTESRFTGPALLEDHAVVSGISTVICGRDGARWGVLGVHTISPAAYDADDVAFVDAVAGILGGAIARRSVEDELAATVDRLRISERIRGAFVNSVSHELRTPLQAVVGFAETLRVRGEQLTDGQRSRALERLVVNTHRLREEIESVLDVGNLDRGLVTAHREQVALDTLIGEVLSGLSAEDVEVVRELQPVTLPIDAPKIARVVAAIVDNALRASPSGGRVTVRLRAVADGAVIEVDDDGPGLDPELREQLFEPFVQGADRDTAAHPGLGLGLTVARGFVELHAGAIRAVERPSGGVRVAVELPAA